MTIMQNLERRVNKRTVEKGVRETIASLKSAQARYQGGTPAEKDSHRVLSARLKSQFRATFFSRIGRRIHLLELLQQQREDRSPIWALVDPRHPIGEGNESALWKDKRGDSAWQPMSDGRYAKAILVGNVPVPVDYECTGRHFWAFYGRKVAGVPALPPAVRRLLEQPAIKQANMVGLLFQPDEWQQVNPDPALIVEWKDRPGEYYALAVWGVDGPRIMEFVD